MNVEVIYKTLKNKLIKNLNMLVVGMDFREEHQSDMLLIGFDLCK